LAPVEATVDEGSPLIAGDDPYLQAEIDVLKCQLQELYASFNALPLSERVQRNILQDEIALVKQELAQSQAEQAKLLVRSPSQGNFVLVDAKELPGRFVRQGELLGYIVADHRPTIRAVVRQDDYFLIQKRTRAVNIRLAEDSGKTFSAKIGRLIPAADINLPSAALGTAGGGNILVDPADPEGLRALENLFQLDISLPEQVANPHIGGRVYVKFEHPAVPIAMQWYRRLWQLFLRKYYV
jgi:putative peptide zinc metalloprotease protein